MNVYFQKLNSLHQSPPKRLNTQPKKITSALPVPYSANQSKIRSSSNRLEKFNKKLQMPPIKPVEKQNYVGMREKTQQQPAMLEKPPKIQMRSTMSNLNISADQKQNQIYLSNGRPHRVGLTLHQGNTVFEEYQKKAEYASSQLEPGSPKLWQNPPLFSPINTPRNNYQTKYAAKSQAGRGPGLSQKQNQDSCFCCRNFQKQGDRSLYIVMDGHGLNGHFISQMVKTMLPQNIDQFTKIVRDPRYQQQMISNALLQSFQQTSRDLHGSGIDTTFSGSTICCVLIIQGIIWCANLGDSRAILVQRNFDSFNCVPLSVDHKPDNPSEKQRILAKGGRVSPVKDEDGDPVGPMRVWGQTKASPGLAMSRSIGDDMATALGVVNTPEIQIRPIREGDTYIIMGSDGVWEWLSNNDVIKILSQSLCEGKTLQQAADQIVQESTLRWEIEGDGPIDDITVIIVEIYLK